MTEDQIAEINKAAEDLDGKIRDYSKSQKEIWRRVPYLALQAWGVQEYYTTWSLAFKFGLWPLDWSTSKEDTPLSPFVDLATGELVDLADEVELKTLDYLVQEQLRPAQSYDVLELVEDLGQINSASIITRLENESRKPYC